MKNIEWGILGYGVQLLGAIGIINNAAQSPYNHQKVLLNNWFNSFENFVIIGGEFLGSCVLGLLGIIYYITYLFKTDTRRYGIIMISIGLILCLATIIGPALAS
jgi:hypothetical protein